MEQDSSSIFPELNIPSLEGYAERWAESHQVIEKITLYPASSSDDFKYVLVFEIREPSRTSRTYPSYKKISEKLAGSPPPDWLNEDFLTNVYKEPPNYDFREDWSFRRVSWGKVPSDLVESLDHFRVLFPSDGRIIRNAQREGFIKMIDLAHVLAGEEIYNDVLLILREIYLKPIAEKKKPGDDSEYFSPWVFPKGCSVLKPNGRYFYWMNLLQRWTKARAGAINNSLEPIESLNSYSGGNRTLIDLTQAKPDYFKNEVRINEFIKYIQDIEYVHQFKIPLPSWFPSKKPPAKEQSIPQPRKKSKTSEVSEKRQKACQDVARKKWAEDPNITITDMIDCQDIIDACDGKFYSEKYLRNWINDLCPNRKPGRRPKDQ